MDGINSVSKSVDQPERKRQMSESGKQKTKEFGSQKSLKSTKSISGSKGSQLNQLRKHSVTASHGLIPTINAEYGVDDEDQNLEEELKEMKVEAGDVDVQLAKTPEDEKLDKMEKRKYMKNLLLLCFGFFFIFTSFLSLRNLQSSINSIEGLGMYTLSCTYAFFFIGCIFATSIVQRLGPKKAIVVMTIGPLLYDFAYFYPTFYTMIPAGGAAGFAQGVIWTAHATYIANIAACYANLSGEKVQNVLSKFNGIFFVFYQSCQIVGGIIASLILKSPKKPVPGVLNFDNLTSPLLCDQLHFDWMNFSVPENLTSITQEELKFMCNQSYNLPILQCGREYCHGKSGKAELPVDRTLVFILVSVFTVITFTGIGILIFFLDPLHGQMQVKKAKGPFHHQLLAVFKFYLNKKALCLCGIMFYSLLQAAFLFGEFNKAFVTCAIGIEYVGFIMMTSAFASANAAFWNGRIQKYTGRWPLLTTAFSVQGAVMITLLFWTPNKETLWVFFVLVIFWGVGDGTIMTQDISLIGFLFANNKEPAFAALKMTQSLANFTFFIAGPYMCTLYKMAFVGTVLCAAAIGYFTLEVIMRVEEKKEAKKKLLKSASGQNPPPPPPTESAKRV